MSDRRLIMTAPFFISPFFSISLDGARSAVYPI